MEDPNAARPAQTKAAAARGAPSRSEAVAMTNASLFAYVADGRNGLRVVQLTSPTDSPGHFGLYPPLSPRLIATYPTHEPALAVSEPLDRDRAVDEKGHQVAVFGRRGAP